MRSEQPVHVVDAEADALHVKRADGAGQRLALGDDGVRVRVVKYMGRVQQRNELGDPRLGPFAMDFVHGHDPTAYRSPRACRAVASLTG